jgi:hypothetical protein
MILAFNYRRNAFVSFLAVILLISALILVDPRPSFADRIVPVRQGTTLAVGCDLSNDDRKFIYPSKVLNYDESTKLTFKCERSGGDFDLQKGESIALRCLHDNPLTIPKHVRMKTGELFYVLCNGKVFGKSSIGRDQGNFMVTPLQKLAGMCDPNDIHVNTTESIICDKPAEVSGKEEPTNMTMTTTTTGTEGSSSSLLPSP